MTLVSEPLDLTQVRRGAVVSADSRYRYRLIRHWGDNADGEPIVFCMLNPSTADAQRDDQTIRVCCQRAYQWRYPGLVVVNLFAFRATKPADLKAVLTAMGLGYARGPDNQAHLAHAFAGRDVVLAWGQNARNWSPVWEAEVSQLAHREAATVFILKRRQNGAPAHPLYVKYGEERIPV